MIDSFADIQSKSFLRASLGGKGEKLFKGNGPSSFRGEDWAFKEEKEDALGGGKLKYSGPLGYVTARLRLQERGPGKPPSTEKSFTLYKDDY